MLSCSTMHLTSFCHLVNPCKAPHNTPACNREPTLQGTLCCYATLVYRPSICDHLVCIYLTLAMESGVRVSESFLKHTCEHLGACRLE